MKKSDLSIFASAFLDGFSLAGFLIPLRRPGAPTRVFARQAATPGQAASTDRFDAEQVEQARQLLISAGYEVRPRNASTAH